MKPIQKIINGKVYNLQVPDNASELDIAKALANEVERLDPLKSGFSVSTNQPQVDIPDLPPIQSRPEDIEKLPTLEETIKGHGGSDVANKIVSPLIEDLGGALDVPKREFQRNTQILGAMLNAPNPGDTTGQAVNRGIISRAIEGDNPSTGQYISKGVFQPEPNESFLKGLGRGGLQTSLDISSDPLLPLSFGKAGNLLLAGMGASHSIPALADIANSKGEGEFGEKLASAGLGGLLAFHGLKGAMGEGPSFSDEVRNSLNPEGAFGLNTPTFERGFSDLGRLFAGPPRPKNNYLFGDLAPDAGVLRTLYHGTARNEFPHDYIGMHMGTEKAATDRLQQFIGQYPKQKLYELETDFDYPFDRAEWLKYNDPSIDEVTLESYRGKPLTDDQANDIHSFKREQLADAGYDTIPYRNDVEDKGSTSYISLAPEKIKIKDMVPYFPEQTLEPLEPGLESKWTTKNDILNKLKQGQKLNTNEEAILIKIWEKKNNSEPTNELEDQLYNHWDPPESEASNLEAEASNLYNTVAKYKDYNKSYYDVKDTIMSLGPEAARDGKVQEIVKKFQEGELVSDAEYDYLTKAGKEIGSKNFNSHEIEDAVDKLWNQGKSYLDIADELHLPDKVVQNLIGKIGARESSYKGFKPKMGDDFSSETGALRLPDLAPVKEFFKDLIPKKSQFRSGYLDQPMDVNVVDPDNIPGYRSQSEVDKEAANYGEIDPIEKRLRSAASYVEDPQMREIAQRKLEEYLRTKKDPREMVREILPDITSPREQARYSIKENLPDFIDRSEADIQHGIDIEGDKAIFEDQMHRELSKLTPKEREEFFDLEGRLKNDDKTFGTSEWNRHQTLWEKMGNKPHYAEPGDIEREFKEEGNPFAKKEPSLEYEKLGDAPESESERGALGPKKLPKIRIGNETFQPDKNQLDQLYELQNEIKSRRESGEDKEGLLKEATERTRQILSSKPGEKYTDTIKELENLASKTETDTREPVKILEQTHGVTVVQFRDGRKQAIPDEKLKDFNVVSEKEEAPLFTEKDLVTPEKRMGAVEAPGEAQPIYLEGFSELPVKTLEKRSKTGLGASSEGSGPKPPARGRKLKNGGNIPPEPPNPNDKFYKDWTAKDWVRDIAQIPQSLRAGFDISAFRNNFFRIATRPELLKDHFKATFQAIPSHEGYKKATAEINDPKNEVYLKLANDNRLNLVGEHAERSHEAGFGSKIAENIPIVGKAVEASERSYSAPINVVRFKTFKNLIDLHGGPENVDADTVSRIARYTNAMTGTYKGKGKIEGLIRATAGIPWSGRNIAGRAELVNPGFYKEMLGDPVLRKELARDLGGTVVLGSTALYLTSEALKKAGHKVKVYYHPTDSKFGSISVDGVNYNIWGGASQPIRLIAQLISQEERTDKGVTKLGPRSKDNKYGKTGLGQVETFFENKLAPVPKFIDESFIKKTDWKGDKITPLQSAKENLAPIPLAFGDLPDIYKDNPDQILPASLLSLLGMDVRPAYKKKSKGNTLLIQP